MSGFIIVTEEQAAALEKAGIPVEIQYIVRLTDMAKLNEPKPEATKPAKIVRPVRFGKKSKLRWTGLKWTGAADTVVRTCYNILHDHFTARNTTSLALERSTINLILSKELASMGHQFNSSFVSYLCEQKYLELV